MTYLHQGDYIAPYKEQDPNRNTQTVWNLQDAIPYGEIRETLTDPQVKARTQEEKAYH